MRRGLMMALCGKHFFSPPGMHSTKAPRRLWHAGRLQHMATLSHPTGAWPAACVYMRGARKLVVARGDRSVRTDT